MKRSENATIPINSETPSLTKDFSERHDLISELDKKYPSFKKGKGYLKLE